MQLGYALQGLGQGMSQGMDFASKLAALRNMQSMSRAHAAVGRAYMGDAPQPPMPGEPSAPAHPPMGNTSPDPMMGNPGAPGALANNSPDPMMSGAPMLPGGGAPPPPGPMPQVPLPQAPAAPTPGGPEAAAAPAGGGAQPGAASQDAQQTIMLIAKQIKAANPNIKPEELFDATAAHIDMMKGVRNDVRDYMQQQIELAKLQTRMAVTQARVDGNVEVAGITADSRRDVAGTRADASRDVAATNKEGRLGAADITGRSREKVAGTQAGARVESANIGAGSREAVAGTNREASDYRADQGYRGKVNGARAFNGQSETAGPPPVGSRSKPGGGSPAPKNKTWTADSLRAAVTAGRVSRQQGEQIARANGWIR